MTGSDIIVADYWRWQRVVRIVESTAKITACSQSVIFAESIAKNGRLYEVCVCCQ